MNGVFLISSTFCLAPTQSEALKEEELLSNIAFKLMQIIDSNMSVSKNFVIFSNFHYKNV